MKTINRAALIIKRRSIFYDWVSFVDPEFNANDIDSNDSNCYLIDESLGDMEQALEKYYKRIFMQELHDWWTNENDYPKKRTLAVFYEWFDVDFCIMAYDLEKSEIFFEDL